MIEGTRVLQGNRARLKELKDDAPPRFLPSAPNAPNIEDLNATLRDASAWVKKLRKNVPPPMWMPPRKRGKWNPELILVLISFVIDHIRDVTNRMDAKAHAKLVANQIRIVSELEKNIEALEKQAREIEAQKGDKIREIESLTRGK